MIKIIRHALANMLIGWAWSLLQPDCSAAVQRSYTELKLHIDDEWSRL
jgi:hypothetical protein